MEDEIGESSNKQNLENMFSSEPTELNYKERPAGRRKIIIDENKEKMNGLILERCKICPVGHVSRKKFITERRACLEAGLSTNDHFHDLL